MIRLLSDMPPGVLGLEAVDDVEKEDYENVIAPAIENAIAQQGKVRLALGRSRDEDLQRAVARKSARLPARRARRGQALGSR